MLEPIKGLHLETFLYMLLQTESIKPPPEPRPAWSQIAKYAQKHRVNNQWFNIPARRISHGFSDPENDEGPDRFFAWDNERPPYTVEVHAFEAQARPISNGEYATYLVHTGKAIPATWTSHADIANRGIGRDSLSLDRFFKATFIKTVYGPVPLRLAEDWPIMASFNECSSYAKWAGHRIPTFDELRSIYDLVEQQKPSRPEFKKPVVKLTSTEPDPEQIFVDLKGCNVGLQHWHPMPVTQNGNRLSGLADVGGAWEWTSSLLEPFEGFKPMDIYPGYTGMTMQTS